MPMLLRIKLDLLTDTVLAGIHGRMDELSAK
jgi:hypothetical protein